MTAASSLHGYVYVMQRSKHEPRRYGHSPYRGDVVARLTSAGRCAVRDRVGDCMTHAQFLRIKKLTGKAIIEVAARHNHREILAEMGAAKGSRIDPARTRLNRVLRGCDTAAGVASAAQTLMHEAGIKTTRKDAVRALEIIFSLPPLSSIDHDRFFNESVQWAGQYFDAPIISAIIHNDEAAPHCHVLLLPLVGGRMIGSDLMGGRAKLQALQADFHAQVGQRHGLVRQTAQKRHSTAIRRQAIDSLFDVLEANSGLNGDALRVLLEPHANNPEPLMMALGLSMPTTKVKGTFVGIMTKPCKPEKEHKPIGFGDKKPIGFIGIDAIEKHQTLCSVGFRNSPLPIPAPITPQTEDNDGDYIRERDTDNAASDYDFERGGFFKPSAKASTKAQVIASVRKALSRQE